jgi:hypothetical protein
LSYNGSGTFVINSSGQPVVTGTVISSTAFNALTADLATGLSTAITKDGQTTTTSRILFAQGISSTLTTDATSATTGSIITAGGISTQKALWVGTTSRLVGNTQHDGLVGIGMTPSNVLDITKTQNASSAISVLNSNAGVSSSTGLNLSNGTHLLLALQYGTGYTTSGMSHANGTLLYGTYDLTLETGSSQPIYFGVNNTEVARFDTSGNLLVGTTTTGGWASLAQMESKRVTTGYAGSFWMTAASGSAALLRVDNTGAQLMQFYYTGSVSVGSISTNGTTTAYNTTSDYRLKENVQPMTGGLATVAVLKPVTYDWISNGSAGEGFIAHELQAVIPEAVYGEKDAVDDKGEIKPQGVDFGKIVPHLVAAIQELTTRLAALENK